MELSDQCEIQLTKTKVEEDSAFDLVAYFRTRDTKTALAPTTIRYKVDCLTTRTALKAWTTVSAAASVTITMTAVFNAIQDAVNPWERKQITIQADFGLSTQLTKTRNWKVFNVWGIGL